MRMIKRKKLNEKNWLKRRENKANSDCSELTASILQMRDWILVYAYRGCSRKKELYLKSCNFLNCCNVNKAKIPR